MKILSEDKYKRSEFGNRSILKSYTISELINILKEYGIETKSQKKEKIIDIFIVNDIFDVPPKDMIKTLMIGVRETKAKIKKLDKIRKKRELTYPEIEESLYLSKYLDELEGRIAERKIEWRKRKKWTPEEKRELKIDKMTKKLQKLSKKMIKAKNDLEAKTKLYLTEIGTIEEERRKKKEQSEAQHLYIVIVRKIVSKIDYLKSLDTNLAKEWEDFLEENRWELKTTYD